MSGSDLDAVKSRREALVQNLAALEVKQLELRAEDQELEVTERVLGRLGDILYGEPNTEDEFEPAAARTDASAMLQTFMQRGLSGGRKALEKVRSAVERRTE